jgi:hypothetical protein
VGPLGIAVPEATVITVDICYVPQVDLKLRYWQDNACLISVMNLQFLEIEG